MPDPVLADLEAEAARKRADTMQSYKDYHAQRPATSMSHDEQVADFTRRVQEAKAKRIKEQAAKTSAQMDADRAAGIEQAPAGSLFKARALRNMGSLGKTGQTTRSGAQSVLDVTDTTAAKVGGTAAKIVLGGDVRGIMQNASVLTDMAGQAMIANDQSIKTGLSSSQERNAESSDALHSKVGDLQAAAKDSPERKKAALSAFKASAVKARDQAELGAYQDLSMKTGADDFSMDETLGAAAPAVLDYNEGDVVKREDSLHGSTYGKFKRTVQTGGLSTSGKLTDEQKADVAKIQKELDDEKDARAAEHDARNAGSVKGQIKRTALMQGSKLTDAEKLSIEDINKKKEAHLADSATTEATLKGSKDQIKAEVEKLKKQQPSGPLITDARKQKHALLQQKIDALQPSLDDARKKLADHRASAKAGADEFDGQVSDIHARADGGFTRAETAARKAKEDQITDIRTGATAAQNFTDKHAGQTINHYGRVGGMIDRMDDPDKMKATTLGTMADYANKGFEHLEDGGKIVGGSADDARDLQEQAKYGKSAATSMVGIGVETAKLASAPLPGISHIGDGTQKLLSTAMKGTGQIGQALTADAAAEERERTHARQVVSGERREELKSKSFVTTRQPKKDAPTVLGGMANLAMGAFAAKDVKDGIMDGLGLGDEKDGPSGPKGDSSSEKPDVAKDSVDSGTHDVGDTHGTGHDVPVGGDSQVEHDSSSHGPSVSDHGSNTDVGLQPVAKPDVEQGPTDVPVDGHHADDVAPPPVVHDAGGGDVDDHGGAPVDDHAGHGVDDHQADKPDAGGDVHPDDVPKGGPEDGNADGADAGHDEDADEGADGKPDEKDAEAAEEPEKPKTLGEKMQGNALDEGYEQVEEGALDKGAEKMNQVLAAPAVVAKEDAPVLHPQNQVAPGPAPGPKPGPKKKKKQLSWWQRAWRTVKKGARKVGRAVKRGFKSAKSWFGRLFGSP